jgi:hypothetical protein
MFSSPKCPGLAMVPTQSPTQWVQGVLSPGVKYVTEA